jgi:hypothetical protein
MHSSRRAGKKIEVLWRATYRGELMLQFLQLRLQGKFFRNNTHVDLDQLSLQFVIICFKPVTKRKQVHSHLLTRQDGFGHMPFTF